jgi:hypothetical protein
MKYTATAVIKFSIVATASIKDKINATAIIKTLSPVSTPCPQYNLIDGGQPQTIYIDINGFNLINGGQP